MRLFGFYIAQRRVRVPFGSEGLRSDEEADLDETKLIGKIPNTFRLLPLESLFCNFIFAKGIHEGKRT